MEGRWLVIPRLQDTTYTRALHTPENADQVFPVLDPNMFKTITNMLWQVLSDVPLCTNSALRYKKASNFIGHRISDMRNQTSGNEFVFILIFRGSLCQIHLKALACARYPKRSLLIQACF